MLCEKCKKRQATTHISRTVNGVRVEKHLCAACAAEEEFGGGLFDMLSTVFGEVPAGVPGSARCELCGRTFAQIAESGRLGCANCYKVFAKELRPSLQKMHGSVKHVGKRSPFGKAAGGDKAARLAELRDELKTSIADEAYEKAAALRDEIKRLEADGQ